MAESIVVGTDGSDTARQAVDEAVRLAGALGAELHVVSAYEPLRGARIEGAPEGAAKVWAPTPDEGVRNILGQASAAVSARGVKVSTHALPEDPADALLKVAEKVGAQLIVVGSKGMHGTARLTLGNVPNKVSHRARCNVLIVCTTR